MNHPRLSRGVVLEKRGLGRLEASSICAEVDGCRSSWRAGSELATDNSGRAGKEAGGAACLLACPPPGRGGESTPFPLSARPVQPFA